MADETGYEAESDTESDTDEDVGAEGGGWRPGLEAMAYGTPTSAAATRCARPTVWLRARRLLS
jgi:hypothetical protein